MRFKYSQHKKRVKRLCRKYSSLRARLEMAESRCDALSRKIALVKADLLAYIEEHKNGDLICG